MKKVAHDLRAKLEYFYLRMRVRKAQTAPRISILIAPPGHGNIGDQALVEAFVTNTPGDILVITRHKDAFSIPSVDADRVEILALPGLIYGSTKENANATSQLVKKYLGSAKQIAVVGADIMDGHYNRRASERRFTLTRLARALGVPASILGFSWSPNATLSATNAARAAGRSGVSLFARDPESETRLKAAGVAGVALAADMVFLSRKPEGRVETLSLPESGPLAILNASGLIAKNTDLTQAYVSLAESLLEAGHSLVLLPHVSRPGNDDIAQLRLIYGQICERSPEAASKVTFIEELVSPQTVRSITRRAHLVVTGRMHLAIMSLVESVPAVTLATQGKVEGLFRLFDLPQLCVPPSKASNVLIPTVSTLLEEHHVAVHKIHENLPHVKDLAGINFSGSDA